MASVHIMASAFFVYRPTTCQLFICIIFKNCNRSFQIFTQLFATPEKGQYCLTQILGNNFFLAIRSALHLILLTKHSVTESKSSLEEKVNHTFSFKKPDFLYTFFGSWKSRDSGQNRWNKFGLLTRARCRPLDKIRSTRSETASSSVTPSSSPEKRSIFMSGYKMVLHLRYISLLCFLNLDYDQFFIFLRDSKVTVPRERVRKLPLASVASPRGRQVSRAFAGYTRFTTPQQKLGLLVVFLKLTVLHNKT